MYTCYMFRTHESSTLKFNIPRILNKIKSLKIIFWILFIVNLEEFFFFFFINFSGNSLYLLVIYTVEFTVFGVKSINLTHVVYPWGERNRYP